MKESASSIEQKNDNQGGGKRSRYFKYAIFFTLTAVILFLLYWFFWLSRPFSLTVRVEEAGPVPGLPFKTGTVRLTYGDKSETRHIATDTIFKLIPAKQKGEPAQLHFESPGYLPIDTTFSMSENFLLPIRRDDSISRIYGNVKDEKGKAVVDAQIIVQNSFSVQTDSNGLFSFTIPLARQRLKQPIRVIKDGYQVWDSTNVTIEKRAISIILKSE